MAITKYYVYYTKILNTSIIIMAICSHVFLVFRVTLL